MKRDFYNELMQDLDDWKKLIDATSEGIDKMERDNWEWKQNRRAPIKNGAKISFVADGMATL